MVFPATRGARAPSWRVPFSLLRLGWRRLRSPEDYRALQRFLATLAADEIEGRGVDLGRCGVLELGAGPGGYSQVLRQRCRSLLASDLERAPLFAGSEIPFVAIDAAARFPVDTGSVDLVFCSNLIEHLARPQTMLSECRRVLRPGGFLYLSFPPFYSLFLLGGHQFKPFHLLGERAAVRLFNWRHGTRVRDYAGCYGRFGLHPLTIAGVEALLRAAGFCVEARYTRASPVNTARWPRPLNDLLTWHVCFLARSPGRDAGPG